MDGNKKMMKLIIGGASILVTILSAYYYWNYLQDSINQVERYENGEEIKTDFYGIELGQELFK